MKKAFNLVANISAIVIMGILLIYCFVLLDSFELFELIGSNLQGVLMGIIVGLIIFSLGTIVVSALAIAKRNKKSGRGLAITVIVLLGIIMILWFLARSVVYGILCLIPIGFEIAAICVHDKGAKVDTQTYDAKIAELKHLKELGAISEEQYDEALKTLFDKAKH